MFRTNVVEKIKIYILFSVTLFRKSYRLWDNVKKYCRAGHANITTRRMRIACWIPKATNTHSEHVILIAFLLQRLHEPASMLRYSYIACLAPNYSNSYIKQKYRPKLHYNTYVTVPVYQKQAVCISEPD